MDIDQDSISVEEQKKVIAEWKASVGSYSDEERMAIAKKCTDAIQVFLCHKRTPFTGQADLVDDCLDVIKDVANSNAKLAEQIIPMLLSLVLVTEKLTATQPPSETSIIAIIVVLQQLAAHVPTMPKQVPELLEKAIDMHSPARYTLSALHLFMSVSAKTSKENAALLMDTGIITLVMKGLLEYPLFASVQITGLQLMLVILETDPKLYVEPIRSSGGLSVVRSVSALHGGKPKVSEVVVPVYNYLSEEILEHELSIAMRDMKAAIMKSDLQEASKHATVIGILTASGTGATLAAMKGIGALCQEAFVLATVQPSLGSADVKANLSMGLSTIARNVALTQNGVDHLLKHEAIEWLLPAGELIEKSQLEEDQRLRGVEINEEALALLGYRRAQPIPTPPSPIPPERDSSLILRKATGVSPNNLLLVKVFCGDRTKSSKYMKAAGSTVTWNQRITIPSSPSEVVLELVHFNPLGASKSLGLSSIKIGDLRTTGVVRIGNVSINAQVLLS